MESLQIFSMKQLAVQQLQHILGPSVGVEIEVPSAENPQLSKVPLF